MITIFIYNKWKKCGKSQKFWNIFRLFSNVQLVLSTVSTVSYSAIVDIKITRVSRATISTHETQ